MHDYRIEWDGLRGREEAEVTRSERKAWLCKISIELYYFLSIRAPILPFTSRKEATISDAHLTCVG